MKFVALVSGGKDSIFSIVEAEREGHELVACVHLGRPVEEDEESYMYQTAGSEVVQTLVEECIQVPLVHYVRQGKSVQTALVYEEASTESTQDEVEDLFLALQEAVRRFPHVQAVASGALLSTYQRVRIENVCQRLGLTSLSYLWRHNSQHKILRSMIQAGLEVVLVRTAAPPGLMPRRHLNRSLMQLESHLYSLYDRYRMHVCGEGGEYESLCLYAPGLYRKRLVLDEVEIRTDEHDDGVGILLIRSCHAEDLGNEQRATDIPCRLGLDERAVDGDSKARQRENANAVTDEVPWNPPPETWLPRVRRCEGGLWHTSGIVSPRFYPSISDSSEADLAVREARDVLFLLKALLEAQQCTPQDVGMVHLYLSDIAHFQRINQYYRQCFGVLLPPSRSCVALGDLPKNRRVMLDCWVLAGSGGYMRRQDTESKQTQEVSPYAEAALVNTSTRYRQVLHVQSLSHWAPVCVGPYSQANTLLGALHFLAGSIGLWPASMTLRDTWNVQLEQSWKNLAQILDALDQSSLNENLLSGMVYVSDRIYNHDQEEPTTTIREISQKMISSNAGVIPGLIDDIVAAGDQHGGYEDEETRMEMEGSSGLDEQKCRLCPLLVVAIPAMPVGAQVEVEIVTSTRAAASCLPVMDYRGGSMVGTTRGSTAITQTRASWDAGYDFDEWPCKSLEGDIKILWSLRKLGVAGAGCATVAAVASDKYATNTGLDIDLVVLKMIDGLANGLSKAAGSVAFDQIFQVRAYYVSVERHQNETVVIDMSSQIEGALNVALPKHVRPAITIIPVHGMEYLELEDKTTPGRVVLALQATFLDPVSLQTELWIRQGRPAE